MTTSVDIMEFKPHFNGKVIEIRAMGYNLISAILELTDNSARKTCSSTKVRVILHKDNTLLNRVSVLDDGCGMSFEKLCESFIFNLLKERQDGDIGKFHVGMKYALIAMGSQITILSRVANDNIVGIFADIESMASRNSFKPCELCESVDDEWALRHITPTLWEQFKSSSSGTIVDVKNLVPSCRSPFDKTVDAIKKGLSTAYTSLYNDCQISLEDEVKKINVITPCDLFYNDDISKLDEPAYETTVNVYNQGIGRPERVIEINTSHRRMPNGAKACTTGTLARPVYYEFTEFEHGKKGKKNNMQPIPVLPDEGDLIAIFKLRVIQAKKSVFEKEKLLFPSGTKLQGDRKGFWFLREIRCVGTAKQLGSKFADRSSTAAERQRMLVKTSCSADDLTGSKFNKQMDDNALPCRALNDALLSIYKQVIDPWNKKYDEIAKKEKAALEAANVAAQDEDDDEEQEEEEGHDAHPGAPSLSPPSPSPPSPSPPSPSPPETDEDEPPSSNDEAPAPPRPPFTIDEVDKQYAANRADEVVPTPAPPPAPTKGRLSEKIITLSNLNDVDYDYVMSILVKYNL